jgi:hypothetical protein
MDDVARIDGGSRNTRTASLALPKESHDVQWEWRECEARSAMIPRSSVAVHFHIKRTREQRYFSSHIRPRTTREAGASAPAASAVPLRLLDAAAVAELTLSVP